MLIDAKNKRINNTDYITFGKGKKSLIIIPGLGDAIKTVKGMAKIYSVMYKEFSSDYRVYVISRRNNISLGFTTLDMAKDIIDIMDELNIKSSSFIGISQGGMIAQEIAINYPDRVNKLVLAVTTSKSNEIVNSVVSSWINYAKCKDYKSIVIDTAEKSYTDNRLRRYRRLYKVLYRIGRPKDYSRFLIQANSCLMHDTYNDLNKIKCKTLIIGGKLDKIVGVDSSYELHDKIKNSSIYIYDNYGHGVYEYMRDFNKRIVSFLNEK